MTPEQTQNLLTLADYLEGPTLKAAFDMENYGQCRYDYPDLPDDTCGSVGCAVGHGPYAGIPKILSDTGYITLPCAPHLESWPTYSQRAFGVEPFSNQWSYLFDSRWCRHDNTPTGAAQRIRTFLTSGVPEEFSTRRPWANDEEEV